MSVAAGGRVGDSVSFAGEGSDFRGVGRAFDERNVLDSGWI